MSYDVARLIIVLQYVYGGLDKNYLLSDSNNYNYVNEHNVSVNIFLMEFLTINRMHN